MASTSYKRVDNIPLTKLHLDPENPRHDPIQDEDKIIEELFRAEKVLNLAKNIVKNGGINPLETIGVVEMEDNPGHYIVAEGNRRTCALKVLHDPRKAPSSATRNILSELKKQVQVPAKFSLVVFANRDAARPWLELRHLGAQDGAGIRSWDTDQKARYAKGNSPDTMALEVLDRATAAGWIDEDTRNSIGITTLTRYLGNPVVRAALGLGDRGSLTFTHDPSEVDVALRQFISDAIPREDGTPPPVNSRTKAKDWKAYGTSLHDRGVSPKTALPSPVIPPAPKRTAKKPRNPRHPDDRPYVVPSDFVVTYKGDRALQRLLWELRRVAPDDFYFSANYLLRAFLERVMVLYAKKEGVFFAKMDDHKLTQACHDALERCGVARADPLMKNLRLAASNADSSFSLHTLGAAVHAGHMPSRRSLIGVWDNWQSALEAMLIRLL
ncbi:hypothetical protein O9649_26335 [Achromobacter dolens]|uniref:hypothetical protein n=1 Tax=Achromobacter dolens TaxID=1287738 RepID=UPI0022B89AE9|nr:hypothetical protein [Achromobacter dolens]MCZ8411311.1 hypothetical protein [Achromobacter dolens]